MKFLSVASCAAILCAASIVPAAATTETGSTSYSQHQADCLVLLLTDPKAHAEQCGGPFETAPPPHGTTGSGTGCRFGEIDPIVLPAPVASQTDVTLVASTCCAGLDSLPVPGMGRSLEWSSWSYPLGRLLLAGC